MVPLGIRPTNDYAFMLTFGTAEKPWNLGGMIYPRATCPLQVSWIDGCFGCSMPKSTTLKRSKGFFRNLHLFKRPARSIELLG